MFKNKYSAEALSARNVLKDYMLVDGYDFVLDLQHSSGTYLKDMRTGKKFVDFFTCFASMPIGMNHPKMQDEDYIKSLGQVALNKPSNADIYTSELATFVKTLFKTAVPDHFDKVFFVSGGALAVENALKTAFDWKVRQNFKKGHKSEKGSQIIHFKQAFHGRTGYTMSLTNTDPNKVMYFPKFEWPRITNPKIDFSDINYPEKVSALEAIAIDEIKAAFENNKDDIAAIIIEPIQGEGGDNHFRPEFFAKLRQLTDENEALLIYDEVQTGVGITGTMWYHEQIGVNPDILCFGKKMQTCGILVGNKIDNEENNVFRVSSRINSTWGGNLTDMYRATRYLEIIEEDNLLDNAKKMGAALSSRIEDLQTEFPQEINNPRGAGLFRAFDMKSKENRGKFIEKCFNNGLFILPCGDTSVRFRPPLTVSEQEISEGFEIIKKSLKEIL